MKKITFLIAAVWTLFAATHASAQEFTLDQSYGTAGKTPTYTDCNNSAMLEDNKLLVAAALAPLYNTANAAIALKKYNDDGTVDTSFGTNGVASFYPQNINSRYVISAMTVQPDGKIIIGGRTHIIGGFSYYYNFFLIRFNADGSVDTGLGNGGEVMRSINTGYTVKELFNSVSIDSNGRILAAGYSENDTNNKADAVAMRFLSNGDTDASFADNGIFMLSLADVDFFSRIKPLGDSIYVMGSFTVAAPNTDMMVIKLDDGGQYDTNFGVGGTTAIDFNSGRDTPTDFYFKDGEKLMIVGTSTVNTLSARIAFAQLNADGTLDTTFSGDGQNVVPGNVPLHNSIGAQHVKQLPDGSFMVFSSSTRNDNSTNNYDYSVIRFNADTSLDISFATNGVFTAISTTTSEYAYGLQVQDDGKVLLLVYSWSSSATTGSIYRYLNAYTLATQNFGAPADGIALFPNPVMDILKIESAEPVLKVEVYNARGAKIRIADSAIGMLDLRSLQSGIYLVKIYTEAKVSTRKIVKQ